MSQEIDETLLRNIIKNVIGEMKDTDTPISFGKKDSSASHESNQLALHGDSWFKSGDDPVSNSSSATATASAPSQSTSGNGDIKSLDWFKHVGVAKPGLSKDEVVIGVAPAFAEVLTKTMTKIPHKDVLRQIIAGIEEEGLKARVVKVYRTSDVSFIADEVDKLSGSGIAVAVQSKGTAIIHQKDQEPLNNLELFPQAPVIDLPTYRAIGKNAAQYAKELSPDPVPTVNDQMARVQYTALSSLMHIAETKRVVVGKPAEEIQVTFN